MKKINRLFVALLTSFFWLACVSAGQESAKPQINPALDQTMRAMFGVRAFQQASISPDGKRVVWMESLAGPDGRNSTNSAIYVAKLDSPTKSVRITAGDAKSAYQEHDVAWSADSKHLVFLSDAAGATIV